MPSSESPVPSDLQREIRSGRKFSLSEAIGREGSSFLKGSQAAVPRPLRALAVIHQWIDQNLIDPNGVLTHCLKQWVKDDVRLGQYLDAPLLALRVIVSDMLMKPGILYEFSRQVAIEWGHINGERPYFQQPNTAAHPKVVYSHQCVRDLLTEFIRQFPPTPNLLE
ncbi:MAG: hypothetical protein AAF959_28225 [Cyanobacteria bacterium P01_D01_bin.56]